ncbi:MAG: LssY C-terminal domain-containing protein [Pseudomonadota bacterium]
MAIRSVILGLLLAFSLSACSSFAPRPPETIGFAERAQSRTLNGVTVTVAALDAEETHQLLGRPASAWDIQAVWVRIENQSEHGYLLAPRFLDPLYYSPLEAATISHVSFGGETNDAIDRHFQDLAIATTIAPGETEEGVIFTTYDEGTKLVTLALFGRGSHLFIEVLAPATGVRPDYLDIDFQALYPTEEIVELDEEGLHDALADLDCCTATSAEQGDPADPLNFVLIGDPLQVKSALIRSGWDETELVTLGSAWRTSAAFLFGEQYRTSPISPLYLFGRRQDGAFQKTRVGIDERNHLRLWLTPWRFRGKAVWVGAISRDIGVKLTTKAWNLTTHIIDPDVDAERWYLVQDILAAHSLAGVGWVEGVGRSYAAEPRVNKTGDPYYTDGLRAVMILADEPQGLDELEVFDWRFPAGGQARREILNRF